MAWSNPHRTGGRPPRESGRTTCPTGLSCPASHVFDRSVNSHREASSPRLSTHETHTVASQKQLESSRITRKGHSSTHVLAPQSKMLAGRKQCASRSTITPTNPCSADLYRHIIRRVGHTLKRAHCKRNLVPSRKQAAYELFGTKCVFFFFALKEFQDLCLDEIVLVATDNTTVVLYINKEEGIKSGPLCALLWRILTWCSPTHSRLGECGSGQALQARPDHPNRVVSPSRGLPVNMQQVVPASDRSICHEVQQQVTSICVTSTGSPGMGSGRTLTQLAMGGSG